MSQMSFGQAPVWGDEAPAAEPVPLAVVPTDLPVEPAVPVFVPSEEQSNSETSNQPVASTRHVAPRPQSRRAKPVRSQREAPASETGWQKLLYRLTGGRVNPSPGQAEVMIRRMRTAERLIKAAELPEGVAVVSVVSLKGGVGKTTTTANAATVIAKVRDEDRVVAIDANTDPGSLNDVIRTEKSGWDIRDIVTKLDELRNYSSYRRALPFGNGGVAVIRSGVNPENPEIGDEFGERHIRQLIDKVGYNFNIVFNDCGTNLTRSLTLGVLAVTNQLVIVTEPSDVSIRKAEEAFNMLEMRDHVSLLRRAILVINNLKPGYDVGTIRRQFGERCRAVVVIAHDPFIDASEVVDLPQYQPTTLLNYYELAAEIISGLAIQPERKMRF